MIKLQTLLTESLQDKGIYIVKASQLLNEAAGTYDIAIVNKIGGDNITQDSVDKIESMPPGNLTAGSTYAAGVCNSSRGVFGSGGGYQSGILNYRIDYVTIASAGNATDFGEPLHLGNQYSNGGSTQTRGVWWWISVTRFSRCS